MPEKIGWQLPSLSDHVHSFNPFFYYNFTHLSVFSTFPLSLIYGHLTETQWSAGEHGVFCTYTAGQRMKRGDEKCVSGRNVGMHMTKLCAFVFVCVCFGNKQWCCWLSGHVGGRRLLLRHLHGHLISGEDVLKKKRRKEIGNNFISLFRLATHSISRLHKRVILVSI